jgi:GntR family transcriptional regulator
VRDKPAGLHVPLYLSMDDPEPMYAQIETQLRHFILGGQLAPGTRLPSMRTLAKELSCSVITTRRAYEDLEGDGYIRTRQGFGTVVAELSEENVSARLRGPVQEAFGEAVRAGLRAGFDGEELHRILEETVRAEETRADRADSRRSEP